MKSLSKIRHMRTSNILLEQRMLQESTLPTQGVDIQTVKKYLGTFISIFITIVGGPLKIPYLIYKIVSGDLLKEIQTYAKQIDAKLKENGINISTADVIKHYEALKEEIKQKLTSLSSNSGQG